MVSETPSQTWNLREIHWPRPCDAATALGVMQAWATDTVSARLVLETRSDEGQIRSLLGARERHLAATLRRLSTAVPGVQVAELTTSRPAITAAGRLQLSTRHRALRLEQIELVVRQLYGVLAEVRNGESLVLQLMLGPRRIPLAVPNQSPSSVVAPWHQVVWHGNGGTVDPEKRSALRAKVSLHGFAAVLRIGASADSSQRRRTLLSSALAAVRVSEAPALQARLSPIRPRLVNDIRTPWCWNLRLNAAEATALCGWPIGELDLPGLPPLHPKLVAPAALARRGDLTVARALAPGVDGNLGYSLDDAMRHSWVLGPNGVGKSTLLLNRVEQDLQAGRAVVVIEPKDLVADVLARIPKSRASDVVVLDPADRAAVVGINPLEAHGRHPELVADSLLATFRALYDDQLGPRSTDILANCLNVLARHPSASLAMIGPLLVNPGFRRSLTAVVTKSDPITAGPFWAWYEALSDEARSQVVAPLQNKLRPLLRPQLRAVLGQRNPRINIRQVLRERKVLLVPLQPGVIGPDAAEILAAVVISELWIAIRERTATAEADRPPVMIYIDEVQQYLRTPVDLADALATSRSLRASWTLAHQFRGQLGPGMLAAFEGNVRNRVAFQLNATDARAMASGQRVLAPEDFSSLPAYHVYAQLMRDNSLQPWASGVTLPPPPRSSDPDAIRRSSRERYAQPLDIVEAGFLELVGGGLGPNLGATGRRRRSA